MAKKRTFEEAKSLVKELNPDLELCISRKPIGDYYVCFETVND